MSKKEGGEMDGEKERIGERDKGEDSKQGHSETSSATLPDTLADDSSGSENIKSENILTEALCRRILRAPTTFLRVAGLECRIPPARPLCGWGAEKEEEDADVVLHEVNTVIRPGEMTLVIGPHGSGKSVFLRACAGFYSTSGRKRDTSLMASGSVSCNQLPLEQLLENDCLGYLASDDLHTSTMTVRETLRLAFLAKNPGRDAEATVERVLELLSLTRCADTMIGNGSTGGISGGERRRLSLGEILICGYRVLCLDEYSTGLDSQTCIAITLALQKVCRETKSTFVCSLQQPPPEVLSLFDHVIALSEGYVIYDGEGGEKMRDYFSRLGFSCPRRLDLGEFLQHLTTETGEKFRVVPAARKKEGAKEEEPSGEKDRERATAVLECTPRSFAEAFRSSEEFLRIRQQLEFPEELEASEQQFNLSSSSHSSSGSSFARQLRQLVWKRSLLLRRDWIAVLFRLFQAFFIGGAFGSISFSLDRDDYSSKASTIWMGVAFAANSYLAQVPALYLARAGFLRHRDLGFYGPTAYALSVFITDIPIQLLETAIISSFLYFLPGLTFGEKGEKFLYFFSLLFLVSLACVQSFQLVIAASKHLQVAQTYGALLSSLFLLYGGFIFSKELIPSFLYWIYTINPIAWAFKALMQNEFLSSSPSLSSHGEQEMQEAEERGVGYLEAYGVTSDKSVKWLSPIVIGGYMLVFLLLQILFLSRARAPAPPFKKRPSAVEDKEEAGVGERVHLFHSISPSPSCFSMRSPGNSFRSQTTPGNVSLAALNTPDKVSDVWKRFAVSPSVNRLSWIAKKKEEERRERAEALEAGHRGDKKAQSHLFEKMSFRPLTLSWRSLSYTVKDSSAPGGEKKLLSNVHGICKPGQMVALMGPTGAGKSTLLNVLARRIPDNKGRIEGEMVLNGETVGDGDFRQCMGYVQQMDVHSTKSTVKESLLFSLSLRLSSESKRIREEFLEGILGVLELSESEDALTGSLSAGQMKLLSVGVEMVSNPALLFLDEPTSALDSRSAFRIVRTMRKIADLQRSVCCTIHQPSSLIFEQFDSLLLMQQGEVVFFGSLGKHSDKLISYFEGFPSVTPLGPSVNPATWMMTVLSSLEHEGESKSVSSSVSSTDHDAAPEERRQRKQWALAYRESDLFQQNLALLERAFKGEEPDEEAQREQVQHVVPSRDARRRGREENSYAAGESSLALDQQHTPLTQASKKKISSLSQYFLCCRRAFLHQLRSPEQHGPWVFCFLYLTVVISTMIGPIGYRGIEDSSHMISLFATIYSFDFNNYVVFSLSNLTPLFLERRLFYRENSAGYYSSSVYLLSWLTVQIPMTVLYSSCYLQAVYWASKLNPDLEAMLGMWCFNVLYSLAGLITAHLISALCSSLVIANVICFIVYSLNAMLSGFYIRRPAISRLWHWYTYINPFAYAYEGQVATQFHGNQKKINDFAGGREVTVEQFVQSFFEGSMVYENLVRNAIVIVGILLVYALLALLLLRFIRWNR